MAREHPESAAIVGWGHADELGGSERFDSGWHAHQEHQLLYASVGALWFEVEGSRWLLPPGRGAWIPGMTAHRVEARSASLRTVYFLPQARAVWPEEVCVFSMSRLARELMIGALEWPEARATESLARQYFDLIAELLTQRWQHERWSYALPTATHPEVERATTYARDNLTGATLEQAAKAAFTSPRTLTRRFKQDVGVTWRAYLHQARMIAAMEQLSHGESVTEVAFEVGFESLSAFSKAFKAFTGDLPSQFDGRM
jgi:AraC-like DNA-binding protein